VILQNVVTGLSSDSEHWVDKAKCRILSQNVDKFSILSKKSKYLVIMNGLEFNLEADLDAKTYAIDLVLRNKYNKDVLELHSTARSEMEATDNAMIYAEMMSHIASGFKNGRSVMSGSEQ